MATTTPNLGLTKPAVSEAADISVLNANFDKIDEKIPAAGAAPAGLVTGYHTATTSDALDSLFNTLYAAMKNYSMQHIQVNVSYGILAMSGVWEFTIHKQSGSYGRIDGHYIYNGLSTDITRMMIATVWQPWEYVNPPMVLGVEYRTTERYNGSAVYCKAVDFGWLPNTTYKAVNHGIDSYKNCVRYEIVNLYSARMLRGDRSVTQVDFGLSSLQITTSTDMSNYKAVVILWYTKA